MERSTVISPGAFVVADGHDGQVPDDLAQAMLRAGYLLEEKIGSGGMADVYRARELELDRLVALKVLSPKLASADSTFKSRFLAESRAAAAINHPNILAIYKASEASGFLFIAMPLVLGGDIQSLIKSCGALPTNLVAEIVRQIGSALTRANDQGLIHRDVKPANILLDVPQGSADHLTGRIYLSDFGISKNLVTQNSLTPAGNFVGTPDYVSPEELRNDEMDGRSDQYSLACSAFAMLTGEPLFRRPNIPAILYAHVNAEPPTISTLRPELSKYVDSVFAKALAKSPNDRYSSCAEFADALADSLTSDGLGHGLRKPEAHRGRPLLVAGSVVLVAVATLAGYHLSRGANGPKPPVVHKALGAAKVITVASTSGADCIGPTDRVTIDVMRPGPPGRELWLIAVLKTGPKTHTVYYAKHELANSAHVQSFIVVFHNANFGSARDLYVASAGRKSFNWLEQNYAHDGDSLWDKYRGGSLRVRDITLISHRYTAYITCTPTTK